jgi:ATP-dependent exoDNAse (exonuclease V) beta subunit
LILSGTLKSSNRSAHLDMLLAGLGLDPDNPFAERAAPEYRALAPIGYLLRLRLIPELPLSSVRLEPRLQAPTLDSQRSYYDRQPVRRPAVRREFSVREISEALEEGRLPGFPALAGQSRELPALPVDPLLAELGLEAGFGTSTHDLLTRWLGEPSGPPPAADWRGVAPEHRTACQEAAVELARRFLDSALGRRAAAAPEREVEVPFVYRWEGEGGPLYLSGQVDLRFEAPEGLCLVDFKTDRRYREGQYAAQLGLYALACAPWSERPILPVVFLLRSGEALPVRGEWDWPAVFAALPR